MVVYGTVEVFGLLATTLILGAAGRASDEGEARRDRSQGTAGKGEKRSGEKRVPKSGEG